ncbi:MULTISPECIES: glutaminase A [unclassified Frankia]|uniref:glutaminase A n=1 Tax=unclassified Frankia TaxID=2632575 RepID=UPI002AD26E46|nr:MULTISPECIES: glutaminase A [unclassified Frankia]
MNEAPAPHSKHVPASVGAGTPSGGPIERLLGELHGGFRDNRDGAVATYIPQLAHADPNAFGIAMTTMDGHSYSVGDSMLPFTIQSVSKPFVYALALHDRGFDDVIRRVGVEPTGDAFNAITLEAGTGRPLNPMVNAGAILTASLIDGRDPAERFERIRQGLSAFAGRELDVDEQVFASEQATGDRNRAIAYLMRNAGALQGSVDEICSIYFRQCAVLVTGTDLAVMAATLALGGVNPLTKQRVVSEADVGSVLAVMGTCGMYDHAGEWLLRVGLPAKSGVAGGICAVLPGQLGVGLYSPLLDHKGNSVRGVLACREMSERFALHLLRPGGQPAHPVRFTYRGDTVSSKRVRPERDREVLARSGAAFVVYELQGDLAFASAERLLRTVADHLDGISWIVFDLRRVAAIDEPAACLLRVLLADLADRKVTTLFVDPRALPAVAGLMRSDWSTERLPDLEIALEWCEEALLMRANLTTLPPTVRVPFAGQELLAELARDEVAVVRSLTRSQSYERGEVIFDAGDPADAIYFVTRGLVNAEVQAGKAVRWLRLNTVPAGAAFGELALVDGGLRSTRITVAEPTECEVLSLAAFEELRRSNPRTCDAIYRAIARSLSARLRRATREIQSMQD